MNREEINKVLDNLQVIEDFVKKYNPKYEINAIGWVFEYIVPDDKRELYCHLYGYNIVIYNNRICVDFHTGVDRYKGIGSITIPYDITKLEESYDLKEGHFYDAVDSKNYLKILDIIVDKIKNNEVVMNPPRPREQGSY